MTPFERRLVEDTRLSFGARGLALFLRSTRESNPCIKTLMSETAKSKRPSGRDQVYGYLNELKACGYLEVEWLREEGRIAGVEYRFLEHLPARDPRREGCPG